MTSCLDTHAPVHVEALVRVITRRIASCACTHVLRLHAGFASAPRLLRDKEETWLGHARSVCLDMQLCACDHTCVAVRLRDS